MEEKGKLIDDIRSVLDFYGDLPYDELYYNPKYEGEDDQKYLYLRLERAVIDQAHKERATSGRYAIWSRDVRFLIKSAIEDLDSKEIETVKEKLIRVLNSLGAFEDIMTVFDSVAYPENVDKLRMFEGYKKYKDRK